MDDERSVELEQFAVECALDAAWATEFWIPGDPDYGFVDYLEAAAARNIGLLHGFEELAEDVARRGILPQTDSDQARLVTDGGTEQMELSRDPDRRQVAEVERDGRTPICPDCGADVAASKSGGKPLPGSVPECFGWECECCDLTLPSMCHGPQCRGAALPAPSGGCSPPARVPDMGAVWSRGHSAG